MWPAVYLGTDKYSGRAELLCTNQNSFNCVLLLSLQGKEVPVKDFPVGQGGKAKFDDGRGRTVTLSFTSFKGVKADPKGQVLSFDGAKEL